MNAIVYNITHHTNSRTINSICKAILKRDFKNAEQQLLTIVERVVHREYTMSNQLARMIAMLEVLYNEFNTYYLQWAAKQGRNEIEEIEALISHSHANFLLAHCTDSESMDDLLYETNQYLTNLKDDQQKNEASYHLECYRKMI